MKLINELQISFSPSIETYNSISELLAKKPRDKDFTTFPNSIPNSWTYEVITKEEDPYFDFINNFLDILVNKYAKLAELGVQRDDITIWNYYEYDGQCNMEYDPNRMKRLGENGITLCITCWDSGIEEEIIYVQLLNEGTQVWRPMWAEKLEENVYLLKSFVDHDPTDEELEFKSNEIVICERRMLSKGNHLVAVKQKQ
jgi:hypothetical protein